MRTPPPAPAQPRPRFASIRALDPALQHPHPATGVAANDHRNQVFPVKLLGTDAHLIGTKRSRPGQGRVRVRSEGGRGLPPRSLAQTRRRVATVDLLEPDLREVKVTTTRGELVLSTLRALGEMLVHTLQERPHVVRGAWVVPLARTEVRVRVDVGKVLDRVETHDEPAVRGEEHQTDRIRPVRGDLPGEFIPLLLELDQVEVGDGCADESLVDLLNHFRLGEQTCPHVNAGRSTTLVVERPQRHKREDRFVLDAGGGKNPVERQEVDFLELVEDLRQVVVSLRGLELARPANPVEPRGLPPTSSMRRRKKLVDPVALRVFASGEVRTVP